VVGAAIEIGGDELGECDNKVNRFRPRLVCGLSSQLEKD
jgi:hypothetical protein